VPACTVNSAVTPLIHGFVGDCARSAASRYPCLLLWGTGPMIDPQRPLDSPYRCTCPRGALRRSLHICLGDLLNLHSALLRSFIDGLSYSAGRARALLVGTRFYDAGSACVIDHTWPLS